MTQEDIDQLSKNLVSLGIIYPHFANISEKGLELIDEYQSINTPEILNFLEGIRRESTYQKHRWGKIEDRKKSAENWFWLIGYLAGKALRSHIEGNKEKALHHTISSAAALANWHEFILSDKTMVGKSQDEDLKKLEK